jgi:hypothetical protein
MEETNLKEIELMDNATITIFAVTGGQKNPMTNLYN